MKNFDVEKDLIALVIIINILQYSQNNRELPKEQINTEMKQADTKKNPKVILLGDINVGKTALIQTLINEQFPHKLASTMGACFQRYTCYTEAGRKVCMDIWDTAGQEKYRSLLTLYYKNSDVIVMVFDLSCRESFETVDEWATLIDQNCEKKPGVILVGNKYDLRRQMKLIDDNEIRQYAKSKGWHFLYVSALENYNVKQVFKKAATLVSSVQGRSSLQKKSSVRIQLSQKENTQGSGCCN